MEKPRKSLVLIGAGALAAVGIAAALIVVSSNSSSDAQVTPTVTAPARALAGIPQRGIELGDPNAPAVIEFADLQCPYCAEFSRLVLPTVVDRYVRTGKVKLVFRGLAFIGPDSTKALRAVLAAGNQNRLWDVLDGLYAAQGGENQGWVTDDLLRQVGSSVRGLSVDRWLADAGSDAVTKELQAAQTLSGELHVGGTPTFFLGTQVLQLEALSPESFASALDPLLAE